MKTYNCSLISKGIGEGELLISKDAVCFYTVEPETGIVIESNHDLKGKNIEGKVLVMPSGKGSSVVQADGLYKIAKTGKAPAAIIVKDADPVLVSAVIIMNIPMVHKVDEEFYKEVKNGANVKIDADNGKIYVK